MFHQEDTESFKVVKYSVRACIPEATLPLLCHSFIHLAFMCRKPRNSALLGSIRALQKSMLRCWVTIAFWLRFRGRWSCIGILLGSIIQCVSCCACLGEEQDEKDTPPSSVECDQAFKKINKSRASWPTLSCNDTCILF